jgi:hypothetical protein
MVSINFKLNDAWSTGYNGTITIVNSSSINYGKNWNIRSDISSNVKITWCDNFNYQINNNQVIFSPKTYIEPLNSNFLR